MPKHFFPGGNTPAGFHSFFHNIPWDGERTIHLKGASGCGKSTFMRSAAAAAAACGLEAEYFHCSNDADSLDGIRVPGAQFCIVDGTAPHVSDPAIPVARDRIFNFADYIDQKAVSAYQEELICLMRQKKQSYDKAYGYLAAARFAARNNSFQYDQAKLNRTILDTFDLFGGVYQSRNGRHRKLFASAVTPGGYVNFLDSLAQRNTVYLLRGGAGTDIFLARVREHAALRGLGSTGLYCPMNPAKPEHLLIPEMRLFFTTCNQYHTVNAPGNEIVFESAEKENDTELFDQLVGMAVRTLAAQRAAHDRIEEIYAQGMDFAALTRASGEMIAEILS